MINEKLDFYVMEASDEEFDTEEVRKLVKRLDELDPIPLPWKSSFSFIILISSSLVMLKPPYIIYMALLDKFLQITTNFFTRNEKTILHRFLTPHNIVLLYLYFHCLCQ